MPKRQKNIDLDTIIDLALAIAVAAAIILSLLMFADTLPPVSADQQNTENLRYGKNVIEPLGEIR